MALAQKKLLLGGGVASLAAVGGVGAWMLMGSTRDNKELRRHTSSPVRQRRSSPTPEPVKTKGDAPQAIVLKRENDALRPELKKPQDDLPKHNVEEQQHHQKPEDHIDTHEPQQHQQQNVKGPDDERGESGRTEQRVQVDEEAEREKLKEQMKGTGINCEDMRTEIYCTTGTGTINVDIDGVKKDDYVFSGSNNGRIKLRISNNLIFGKKFSFDITGKSIKLENKNKPSDTITLEKYEKYELVKDGETNKVYLTRKLNAEKGMIKELGLPDKCSKNITSNPFNYKTTKDNPTCELWTSETKLVNFDGKKDEGATSEGNLKLFIQKVKDTTTYKDGYRFYFQGYKDIDISEKDKLAADVWWDFKLKEGEKDKLLLERVWKSDTDLLSKVGLSCGDDGRCTIKNNSLKIKVGNSSLENGNKKSGDGTIYLEKKNMPGHYEGLRFSVWEGGMEIENSASGSPIKMKEAEIYHITKEDSPTSSYYLTKKHDVEEIIRVLLGISSYCPPRADADMFCSGSEIHLKKIKFHDGDGEKTISDDIENLSINIEIKPDNKSPLGYKFSLKTSKSINIGKISLTAGSAADFKIKKDIDNKKLYLERAV